MLRPALIGVVALGVAAALPGVAWAHGGGTYTAITVATPPVIDGNLSDPAWANAPSYPLTFGTIPANDGRDSSGRER